MCAIHHGIGIAKYAKILASDDSKDNLPQQNIQNGWPPRSYLQTTMLNLVLPPFGQMDLSERPPWWDRDRVQGSRSQEIGQKPLISVEEIPHVERSH